MRKLKKCTTTAFMVFALGLMMTVPAAAQTVQAEPAAAAAQSYTVQVTEPGRGNGSSDSKMTFTVTQKPGAGGDDVIITWIEDSQAKAGLDRKGPDNTTAEYQIETARKKAVNID